MAEIIESHEFGKKGPCPTYAWDQWFDGRIWKLTRGDDFHVQPTSFSRSARQAAGRRGLTLRVSVDGDAVIVQAVKP